MPTKLTKNTVTTAIAYIESEGTRRNNLQSVCEALGGSAGTEGLGTWTAATSLTITDTRVLATSRIIFSPVTNAPVGLWYVSSIGSGTFTITSTETETAGTLVHYIVINI